MGIEQNNGDAISCIVLMLDSLASENNSVVTLETFHSDSCGIFNAMKEEDITNESINKHHATSQEARHHLYSCTCDATIESTFERGDGETLLVQFVLSDVIEKHPWLEDPEQTEEMIRSASQEGLAPLIEDMKPSFKKRMGKRPHKLWTMPLSNDDVVH